jgi:hypothetical protein
MAYVYVSWRDEVRLALMLVSCGFTRNDWYDEFETFIRCWVSERCIGVWKGYFGYGPRVSRSGVCLVPRWSNIADYILVLVYNFFFCL